MRKLFNSISLRSKIFIACISVVILTASYFSIVMSHYMVNQTIASFRKDSNYTLVQGSKYIDEKLRSILSRSNAMRENTLFDATLKNYLLNDNGSYALALSYLSNSLIEIRSFDTFIDSVFLHTPKGDFYDLSQPLKYGSNFQDSALFQIVQKSPTALYWGTHKGDVIYKTQHTVIPVIFRFNEEGYNGDMLLCINLNEKNMIDYLKSIQSVEGNSIIILNDKGQEVLSTEDYISKAFLSDKDAVSEVISHDSGQKSVSIGAQQYYLTYTSEEVAPWKVINIKSEKGLEDVLFHVRISAFFIVLISSFLCFFLSWIIAKTIVKPLVSLQSSSIEVVKHRDFSVRFQYDFDNEVGRLGSSFNYMLAEIEKLVSNLEDSVAQLKEEKEKVRIEQLLKRRAELKALQAQINPHFLYNTLDSINWKAAEINADEISTMITALATLFRTGLSKGNELVPFKDEITNITSYLVIQKIRYGDSFDYNISIRDDLMKLYTIKLILQPLIENAIYHGIKEKQGTGHIQINIFRQEQNIKIEIIDDGEGIPALKMQLINKRLSNGMVVDTGGYGIYNVNERIRLYFGENYGLELLNNPTGGAISQILVPAIEEGDVEKYVHYFDYR